MFKKVSCLLNAKISQIVLFVWKLGDHITSIRRKCQDGKGQERKKEGKAEEHNFLVWYGEGK